MAQVLQDDIRKAFSDAAIFTFAKMLMVDLAPVPPGSPAPAAYDISAIIGFSGAIAGTCVLRLSAPTAQAAVSGLAGEAVDGPEEIADGVGELVNMIAGNAKAALQDAAIALAFPEIVRGPGHSIGFHRFFTKIELFFSSSIGDVTIVVAYSAAAGPGANLPAGKKS